MPDRRRAWAAALFAAAADAERRSAYAEALEALAASVGGEGAEGRSLRDFLRDPDVPREEKIGALASAAAPPPGGPKGEADPLFRRFCALLVEKGRGGLLPAIAVSYRLVLDRAEGVSPLEVEAAREPPPGLLSALGEAWAKSSGAKSARTSLRLRPELIAGYRLRSGSIRLDYSVAGRALRLERELARPLGTRPEAPAAEGHSRGEG